MKRVPHAHWGDANWQRSGILLSSCGAGKLCVPCFAVRFTALDASNTLRLIIMFRIAFACVVFVTSISLSSHSGHAETLFEFTKVVVTNQGTFGNLGLYPQINNQNQVSFVQRASQTSGEVFRWQDGTATSMAIGSFISNVPINDLGAIAYSSSTRGYIVDDTGATELFSNSRGVDIFAVNNSGDALAVLEDSNGDFDVYTRRVGQVRQRRFSSGSFNEYSDFLSGGGPGPDLNNHGEVAVRGSLRAGAFDGVYVHSPGSTETIVDSDGPLRQFGNIVDINDNGDVAYFGVPDSAPSSTTRTFFVDRAGSGAEVIADLLSFESLSEAGSAINNTGGVVFGATADGVAGIFVGGDPSTDRVISVGDTLDGGTVTSLLVRRGMINDSGNFVFRTWLDDDNDGSNDREAIFLVTSVTAIPEPSLAGLLGLASVAVVCGRRRRQRIA